MSDKSNGSMMELVKKVSKISNHDESKGSMIALITKLSTSQVTEECIMTGDEYQSLILELYNSNELLQKKYNHYAEVPRIYSLFGVKITIM